MSERFHSPNLDKSTIFFFSFGQLAEGLMNSAFAILLFFYFNQVLGLSGTLCGLALLIATSIDAITDPVMGTISDNWRSSLGRRHPFMYASALPLAISFYFLFAPAFDSGNALFVWLTGFAILTRMSMTLFHVPHMAFGAELSDDFDRRTNLVAYRMLFGVSGWILLNAGFAVLFAPTDEYPNGQLNPENYPWFAGMLSIGIFVSIILTSWGTRSVIPLLHQPPPTEKNHLNQSLDDVRVSLSNVSFRWLVISYVIGSIPAAIAGSLALYVNTFYWELTPSQIPAVMLAGSIATLVGYAIAPIAGRLVDKRQLMMAGAFLWAIATLTPFAMRFLGVFPPIGTPWSVAFLMCCAIVGGAGLAQLVVAVSSMLADVADEHELSEGQRSEGVFFGVFSFCTKASSGIGIAIAGILIDLIAWPTGATIRTAADIPADTLTLLAVIADPLVVVALSPVFYCIRQYKIDRTRHAEIQIALNQRRR